MAKLWSMRTALALVDNEAEHAFDDMAVCSSEVLTDMTSAAKNSTLIQECFGREETRQCYAVQFIRSFNLSLADIEIGEWVLCVEGPLRVVGRVSEIAELFCPTRTYLRMLLIEAHIVLGLDETAGGAICIDRATPCLSEQGLLISCESCSFSELHVEQSDSEYIFTYQ